MSNGSRPTNGQQALTLLAGSLPANVAALMKGGKLNDDLAGGITTGFAVVSLRGKVWRIKHRGEEKDVLNEQNEPRYSLEVVLVKASENIAKIFYEKGYEEGSVAPPDCWSADGKVPDPASPALQQGKTGPTCAGCWANAWGSRASQTGSKGKACADSKRLAIVPLEDLENDYFGGPMLMRVPPASLGDVKAFADKLGQMGFPYFAVATRISFDRTAEYPKLQFGAIRLLTEEEAAIVLKHRESPIIERILNTAIDHVETDGVDPTHGVMFEQPPGAQQKPPAPRLVPAPPAQPQAAPRPPQPAPVAPPAPPPVPAQVPTPENTPRVTAPVNVTLPEGWMVLPDGKFYHADHGVTDRVIEPEAPEPKVELVPLPGGKFYNPVTGEIVGGPPAAPPVPHVEAEPVQTAAPAPKATRQRKAKEEPKVEAAPAQVFEQPPEEAKDDAPAEAPADFESILDGMLG